MVIKKTIEKAMEEAKFSLETEGFMIMEEHTKLVKERLEGRISEEEFLKEVRRRVTKEDEMGDVIRFPKRIVELTEEEHKRFIEYKEKMLNAESKAEMTYWFNKGKYIIEQANKRKKF